MKKIHVEVCVCTACVMNGSVDLMESVESLRELRGQMEEGFMTEPQGELEITTNKCLGGVPHQEDSPVVAVEGKVFTARVPERELERAESAVRAVSLKNEGDGETLVRYVAEGPLLPGSDFAEPRLEDLYLWLFRGERRGEDV